MQRTIDSREIMLESSTDHEVLYEALDLYKLGIEPDKYLFEDEDDDLRKYLETIEETQGSLKIEGSVKTVSSGLANQINCNDPVYFDHSEETLILGALKYASVNHPDKLIQIFSLTMYEEYWESAQQNMV